MEWKNIKTKKQLVDDDGESAAQTNIKTKKQLADEDGESAAQTPQPIMSEVN